MTTITNYGGQMFWLERPLFFLSYVGRKLVWIFWGGSDTIEINGGILAENLVDFLGLRYQS